MTPKELYDHITKHMTPEAALLKLLEGSCIQYEKLKFETPDKAIHPVILISMATMDLGWDFAIESADSSKDVRGMVVGTPEYMNTIFPKTVKDVS